jgi:hypothetical protein
VEELEVGWRLAEGILGHLHRIRALQLEAVRATPTIGPQRGPQVKLEVHVVAPRLGVVRHPVQRRGPPDEVELVLGEREEDHVADHVAVGGAGNKVLRAVERPAVEAVDAEVREQRQRSRPSHQQVVHVERLVEEQAACLPRALLVAPVRELRRDAREDVRTGL